MCCFAKYWARARKEIDLGQGRKVYFHKATHEFIQDHLHFVQHGAQLFAINKDGTAHDKSHGIKMANWTVDAIKKHHPAFKVPPGKLIERMLTDQRGRFPLRGGRRTKDPPVEIRMLVQFDGGLRGSDSLLAYRCEHPLRFAAQLSGWG